MRKQLTAIATVAFVAAIIAVIVTIAPEGAWYAASILTWKRRRWALLGRRFSRRVWYTHTLISFKVHSVRAATDTPVSWYWEAEVAAVSIMIGAAIAGIGACREDQ